MSHKEIVKSSHPKSRCDFANWHKYPYRVIIESKLIASGTTEDNAWKNARKALSKENPYANY